MIVALIVTILILILYSTASVYYRKMILCGLSIFIYYQFVKGFIVFLPIVVFTTFITIKWINTRLSASALIVILHVIILILLFQVAKSNVCQELTVGYSVLLFSSISAVVDSSKEKHNHSFLDILLYLCYFPKILAGPIERIYSFKNQFSSRTNMLSIYSGVKIIIYGCFIKYFVADQIGSYVQLQSYGINRALQIGIFAIQFYLDFWSYCIIAIGISQLFDIELSINFNKPYSAKSFHEFWDKWNISLSKWLRDYVYIPCGGNKSGGIRRNINIMIVFVVSALWHGVTLPFLLWGIIHGLFLVIEKSIPSITKMPAYRFIVIFICTVLWQLFCMQSIDEVSNLFSTIFQYSSISPIIICTFAISVFTMKILESNHISSIIYGNSMTRIGIWKEVTFVFFLGIITLIKCANTSASNFFYFSY